MVAALSALSGAAPPLSGALSPLSGAAAPLAAPAVADAVVGWLWTVALFLFPGIVAAGLCAPFLAAERLRALFRALPPTGRLLPSYLGVSVGLSVPYLAGVVLTVARAAEAGPAWSSGFLLTALLGAVAVGLVAPAVAVFGLPRLGLNWDPTGYGVSTYLLLGGAGLWYAAVAAVPLVALAVGMALPGGY
ncbi:MULTISPECIES: hypothetical protein [Halorubrum]|uniref:DUF8162 domain-containing protein n=1 Tax=Halorubrum tropicale TaxID=1765655 RepID=A0A0N0BSG6_9EURY|nr:MULTISPECIES: hypothetical protein [Halorubrum]KOX98220.1 hypothetical protein AMR74_04830 [Halorubrum tropicale]TKX42722.1 hypothetical protein EXE50_13515 [Halorubrum sp. ARQ200]TKX58395.1 hypothetical protein EXE48_16495 [Halorubrum sp. ASP1]